MTAQELYEKYQADLVELRRLCPHYTATDWLEEQWAPGHLTGSKVRVCERCGFVVDRKSGHDENNQMTLTIN